MNSTTGAGKQEAHVELGNGVYELIAACLYTEKYYPISGEIAWVRRSGDGTLEPQGLVHGFYNHQIGLTISSTRILEGPGYILGIGQHLESDGYSILEVMYRKVA